MREDPKKIPKWIQWIRKSVEEDKSYTVQDCIIKTICCLKELKISDDKIIMVVEKYFNIRKSSVYHLIAEAEELLSYK